MFQPKHWGLYFSVEDVQRVSEQQNKEPTLTALTLLRQRKPLDMLEIALFSGLLYRFDNDIEAGGRAVDIIQQQEEWRVDASVDQIAMLMTWAQCFEMVRDHPHFAHTQAWRERFAETVNELNTMSQALYVEQVWLNALLMVAGVVLEDAAWFDHASHHFREMIQHDVHPDGYIRRAAEGEKGMSLHRMLLTAQALILTAEAASHAGEDLWAFNVRGVSALTPTPYLLYYYYFPEKWRWDADIESDAVPEEGEALLSITDVQALYKRHGGLWEMAQRRSFSKDRETLLQELRPVVDIWGGGLVTLTHGQPQPSKRRFGLF